MNDFVFVLWDSSNPCERLCKVGPHIALSNQSEINLEDNTIRGCLKNILLNKGPYFTLYNICPLLSFTLHDFTWYANTIVPKSINIRQG